MARRWQVGWVVTQSIRPPAFANHAADVWANYLLANFGLSSSKLPPK
jgi:hypothetical protein